MIIFNLVFWYLFPPQLVLWFVSLFALKTNNNITDGGHVKPIIFSITFKFKSSNQILYKTNTLIWLVNQYTFKNHWPIVIQHSFISYLHKYYHFLLLFCCFYVKLVFIFSLLFFSVVLLVKLPHIKRHISGCSYRRPYPSIVRSSVSSRTPRHSSFATSSLHSLCPASYYPVCRNHAKPSSAACNFNHVLKPFKLKPEVTYIRCCWIVKTWTLR